MAGVGLCLALGFSALAGPAAGASISGIALGAATRLPVTGSDAEDPVLAMNAAGRYVIAYAQTDPFGPFGVLTGNAASGRIQAARVRQLGNKADVSPVQPAVGSDGQVALGWSVRRQLHPANRVAFGIDIGTRAARPQARWVTRTALVPTMRYDPSDDAPAPSGVVYAGRRLLEDWTTQSKSASRLVLARQTAPGGRFRARVLLRTTSLTTIQSGGLAVDGNGDPVLVASLQPVLRATDAPSASTSRESVVAFTAQPNGRLGGPQRLRRGCNAAGLAVAASGQAAVVMLCNTTGGRFQVWVSERAPDRRFGPAQRVSGPGVDGVFPSVRIIPDGRVCLAWDRVVGTAKTFDANIVRTDVSCARPDRRFGRPSWQTDPYPTQLNGPQLLAEPSGLTLTRGDRDGRVILQRLLPHSHLGPVVALSGPWVRNQTVMVDSHGHGIAVWDTTSNHRNQPQARSFTLPYAEHLAPPGDGADHAVRVTHREMAGSGRRSGSIHARLAASLSRTASLKKCPVMRLSRRMGFSAMNSSKVSA